MLKSIALQYRDNELYKLACELEKIGVTNPIQMAIQKNMLENNPTQALHYDRVTSLAARAKNDPTLLGKLRQASLALKQTGVSRLDDSVKQNILSKLKKPVQMAKISPLNIKPLSILSKVK